MALVGTISGSNGTSTTAISGSLIIADEPVASFPALASGIKLFVSGSKTELGADTPNAVFGGDTFVSGALGTDSYFQMKPVGTLRIPTNTTASYIYTSGSTNDLYFTQYSGPYTNTTRLRWLESALSTGLLHGGVLSTENGTTTFSITSGSGLIIDFNASTVVEPYPVIVQVDWPAYVSSSLPNIATTEITYIAIDSTGALVKQSTAYANGDFEDKIVIGRVLHQSGSVTNGTITSPTVAYGQTGFRGDFIRAFGPLKLSGHVVSVNATATNPPTNTQFLGLAKTAGDSYVEGRNYTTNPDSPNYIKSTTDTALTTSKIYREYVNSSGTVIIDSGVAGAGYTAIDVTNYNNGGVLTAIGSGNKFTIQRLYWFPNSVNRAIFAYYGGVIYTTIADAEAGIQSEAFTEGDNTRDAAILLGYLIVKEGATDLNDVAQAKLIQAGLSRAVSTSGGGGGSTTPGGSDTYVQYNDGGSFNGAPELRFVEGTGAVLAANLVVTGSTAGSLVSSGTLQVKSGAGAVVASISTGGVISGSGDLQMGGNITGSNLYLAGDITVIGGDIATTAATFNLVTGSATTVNFASNASAVNIGAASSVTSLAGDLNINASSKARFGSAQNLTILHNGSGGITNTTGLLAITNQAPGQRIDLITSGSSGTAMLRMRKLFNNVATDLLEVRNDGNIMIGSGSAGVGSGSTTVNNDLFLNTGIIAVNSDTTSIQLVSSGNVTIKLDANNNAPGHFFAIRDSNNVDQLRVTETGDTDIRGNLTVTGSVVATTTSGTFNLLNTGLTGTLNIGGAATTINFGSIASTGSFRGDLAVQGRASLGGIIEDMFHTQSAGGTLAFNTLNDSIFYVNSPTSDITANFTNVPTTAFKIVTPTVILSQSATPRIVSAVQIDGVGQPINWSTGITPTGTANKQDVFGFSLIRSGSAWKILGQMSSYG